MRVAVTGAGGFVGGALCRLLVSRGCTVVPLDVRIDQPLAHTSGVPVLPYDITSGPLRHAPPVDAVVHAAALVSDTGALARARRVNVDGTANVVATFPGARFVQVSSGSVYDPHRPQHHATEDQAPMPDAVRWSNAYGRTKSEAEALLRTIAPEAVVLRPHAVYGPGDTTLMPRLREAGRRGPIPIPSGGRQLHSITSVDNLVQACFLACQPDAPPGTYNVNDGAPVPLADVVRALAASGTRPVRIVPVPAPVLGAAATVLQSVAAARSAITGRRVAPRISRYVVEHLALERTFDTSAIRQRLGFSPAPSPLASAPQW
jgi:2-alkyl-3-oxoalkanoate reductase